MVDKILETGVRLKLSGQKKATGHFLSTETVTNMKRRRRRRRRAPSLQAEDAQLSFVKRTWLQSRETSKLSVTSQIKTSNTDEASSPLRPDDAFRVNTPLHELRFVLILYT